MKKDGLRLFAVFLLGVGYWSAASVVLSSGEPWDSPNYSAWFLGCLAISAAVGWLFRTKPWRWGPILVFGQAPVILVLTGLDPMFVVALGWITLEAIPALIVSAVAGRARTLWVGRRGEPKT